MFSLMASSYDIFTKNIYLQLFNQVAGKSHHYFKLRVSAHKDCQILHFDIYLPLRLLSTGIFYIIKSCQFLGQSSISSL